MKRYGEDRCKLIGRYIIETTATVRQAANVFGVSKSTVHKGVTENLKRTDKEMYAEVKSVLDKYKSERHIRGGDATKRKYASLKRSRPKP